LATAGAAVTEVQRAFFDVINGEAPDTRLAHLCIRKRRP
jgi:hypothetical protein